MSKENYIIHHRFTEKVLYVSIIVLLGVLVTACTVGGGTMEEKKFAEQVRPTLLNLEYIYSTDDVDLSIHTFGTEGEFTWFETFFSRGITSVENVRERIKVEYGIELPEIVDFENDNFVVVSIGRRLQMLYYFEESRYDTHSGQVIARPVFERKYYPNTIFVYRGTSLPTYGFVDQWLLDDDRQFNTFKNIPFEVWRYDRTVQSGGKHPDNRPFQREEYDRISERQELEKPLHGYVKIQETHLRSMPTENSRIIIRLIRDDDFTILGYVEDNGGSGRWYYVWTSIDSGNQIGYIHSNFITINEEMQE